MYCVMLSITIIGPFLDWPYPERYIRSRKVLLSNRDNMYVEVWYLRNWAWKYVLFWFMPLKSLTLIVWKFPGNPGAISRDSVPGKNVVFPGFPGKQPHHFPVIGVGCQNIYYLIHVFHSPSRNQSLWGINLPNWSTTIFYDMINVLFFYKLYGFPQTS